MSENFQYQIGYDDVDLSQLPENSRTPGSNEFRSAVNRMVAEQYSQFSGNVQVVFDDDNRTIQVSWRTEPGKPDPADVALAYLQQGDFTRAIPLLRLLLRHNPENATHLYNLGMALSDRGELEEAQQHLFAASKLDPSNINALVALGVAQVRAGKDDEAIKSLEAAVVREPRNPWALRNLGACLLKAGKAAEAESFLRRCVDVAPEDQQGLLGLGQALEALGNLEEADESYSKSISLGPNTQAGSVAKEARTRLAHRTMREAIAGGERPDVVMYCLGALERFESLPSSKVQAIGFEIAILGMKGLDINDPTQKYTLKSLPGKFSGLHLVSLMYVAFKDIAPDKSVGIDLSREYAAALSMFKAKKQG